MLNGTCARLQVRRVSTVISRTETRWENVIEKSKMRFKCGFGFGLENSVAWRTQRVNLELWTLKMRRNNNKTIHNAQQCTAGYGAKRLINLIQFYWSYPCFCRGVTTQRHEPRNNNATIKQESTLVL